jgi:hypothetical protein
MTRGLVPALALCLPLPTAAAIPEADRTRLNAQLRLSM